MRFLIVKTSALGDILHAFDVLAYLKGRFPTASIDWIVEKEGASLLQSHPLVDAVFVVDTRQWRKNLFKKEALKQWAAFRLAIRKKVYDAAFDLQGNCKSALLLAQVRAKKKVGFGFKSVPEWPNLLFTNKRFNPPLGGSVRSDLLFLVQSHFKDKNSFNSEPVLLQFDGNEEVVTLSRDKRNTLVCPGARWPNKRLSFERLKSFLKKRQADSFFFFSWGNDEEKRFCQELALHFNPNSSVLEKHSLVALQNLMAKMDLVIAMDSMPLHLAATTATPTLSFFGPSSPKKYAPQGVEHKTLQGECYLKLSFEKRCPYLRTCKRATCMQIESD